MKKELLIIPLIFLLSCEKNISITPENTEPVFYASFETNEMLHKWEAGEEDYYMFTGTHSDSFDVKELYGTLQPQYEEGKNAIQFKFRNTQLGSEVNDSLFKLGERDVTDSTCGFEQNTKIKVKFKPNEASDVYQHRWTINGTIISFLDEPEYTFDSTEINNFPVYLHSYFNDGCIATVKRCLDFRNMNCAAEFDFYQVSGFTYQFDIPSNMINDVEKVIWYIGDDTFETNSLSYTFQSSGNHFVNADIFFKDGCAGCIGKKLQVDPFGTSLVCNNNFTMEFIPLDHNEHLQLGSIEINYWDNSGDLYSSRYAKHDEFLTVTSVDDYKENGQGHATKKVELEGSFTLYNKQGQFIQIDNFKGAIGVAAE